MKSFFKIFFASLLALVVFSIISFFVAAGFISGLASRGQATTGNKAVMVIDLNTLYPEITVKNPLPSFSGEEHYDLPSLYDVIRLIDKAKADSAIKGIYIKCSNNSNGFGASDEIRKALADFKTSKKFIYAYADVISQRAYHVANISDKIYCNPKGGVDWRGFALQLVFLKGTLQKLEIEPQIFYAGKFKSATEPFRETQMTDANRLQTTELLYDLYNNFLATTAAARNIDTATLKRYADQNLVQYAADAFRYKLVDGLKYDDEVQDEIRQRLNIDKYAKLNFVSIAKYAAAVDFTQSGTDKIAIIYATGDIVDGRGSKDQIGGETYRNLIRRVRLDKTIKAIVIRVNSGGGSAMASENIWREVTLARNDKPVVISFGDVAASGGYYMSCSSDSIFAQPNTITGSIGVFSLLPNMQNFFNNKLGVTFDGVKTSENADALTVTKPLTPMQRQYIQNEVDTIYHDFKTRVSEGRKKTMDYVDSIAQGRVWSGSRALQLGLVDRLGGLSDAVASAAKLAKLKEYRLRQYPDPPGLFDNFFEDFQQNAKNAAIEKDLGADGIKTYSTLKRVKQLLGITQARIPFDMLIE
ncbi:MAG: signal peptide peptidase SppA [Chitinophagaceae bacterium]|nr:signal peptide peptidase SppA [Chitinophagaceae bacterium]